MKYLLFTFIFLLLVACGPQESVLTPTTPSEPDSRFITILEAPEIDIPVGVPYEVAWKAEGGTKFETRLQYGYDLDFTTFEETELRVNGPGVYMTVVTLQEVGTVYMRAHALIDGTAHYSDPISRSVI